MVRTNWMLAVAAACLLGFVAEVSAQDDKANDYVAPRPGPPQSAIPPLYFNHYYPVMPNGQIPRACTWPRCRFRRVSATPTSRIRRSRRRSTCGNTTAGT